MENPTARRDARPGRRAARWAAILLAAAPLPGAREIPVREIAPEIGATVPVRLTAEGLSVDVDGQAGLFLPLPGAEALQLDHRTSGLVMVTWVSAEGTTVPHPQANPWHREILPPGAGRVSMDLRATPLWTPDRSPFLFLEGTGTVVLTGLRARMAPAGPEARRRSLDEALRWSPVRVGHSTINSLDFPPWSASSKVPWQVLLGVAFVGLALAGVLGTRAWRRAWRPGPSIAVAAVAVALAGNAVFAVRAAPALALRPSVDPEERLRGWNTFDPELGPLAALARGAIGPRERVGVQAPPGNWFAWETLCFHLAPRPCVRVMAGADEFAGLGGVYRLRPDELDAVVSFHAGAPLPAGFVPSIALDRNAFVARRR